MAEKYFHHILGNDAGAGTAADPYKTYDRARAMAGADEVYGGGIGCGTWAKIRFCASDGDEANSGLTPDSPKQSFVDMWNALGGLTDDFSAVVLVKGSYTFSNAITLTGGGRRNTTYCGTNKMLRGYTGSDYFATGKAAIQTQGTDSSSILLNACDNAIFKNLVFADSHTSGGYAMLAGVTAASYHQIYEDCIFSNISGPLVRFSSSPLINYAVFNRCRALGRGTAEATLAFTGSVQFSVFNCYISGFVYGISVGSAQNGVIIQDTIIEGCTTGIKFNYVPGPILTRLVIANCSRAISEFGYSAQPRFHPITNSIFYNNTLVLDVDFGTLLFENCCLWPNAAATISKASGNDTVDTSFIGEGCFIADPQFVDAANGDYRLGSTSPCWNMGLSNPFIVGNKSGIGPDSRNVHDGYSRSRILGGV